MNSDKAPIRVGLLGYGLAGKVFHAPLIAAEPSLRLVAVSSSQNEAVRADWPDVSVSPDARALATHPAIDLVVVATPNHTHAELTRAALQAGKDVVVDKPFAVSLSEARELVDLAKRVKKTLTVFHNRRWDSDFLTVRKAIEANMIGRIVHFESHIDRYRPVVRDRWRERPGPGSGLWFDLGPHLVDQTLQLFGLPEVVMASMDAQRASASTDDWAHVVLEFDRMRAVLHASTLAAGGSHRFTVHGETGSLVKAKADQQEAQIVSGMKPGDAGWGQDDDALLIFDADGDARTRHATPGDQRQFYATLARALSAKDAAPVAPHHAIAVMAVIEAAIVSASEKRAVPLALTRDEREAWAT